MGPFLKLSPKHILIASWIFLWCFSASEILAQIHSGELPVLVFGISERDIPGDEKTLVSLQIVDNGLGQFNSVDGPFDHYDGYVGIKRRGSTSRFFDKNGFSLELRSVNNDDIDFPLLGMPAEEDWVLHGPYSDKTLLRNAYTFLIAQSTSTWAPKTRFCEVFFEDDYRGVYLLVERIKRDDERLDIAKVSADDISGLQLTGGYILKIDKSTGESNNVDFKFQLPLVDQEHGFSTSILYHDPAPDEIQTEQKLYIQAWMEEFESRLAGIDFANDQLGFRPLIDMESWIDFFFINEITRNVDGYRLSTYMHKRRDDKGGKLHMGPIWDFNLALGNADYCNGSLTTGWAFRFNEICPAGTGQVPFHYQRMLEDTLFSTTLTQRWEFLRTGEWSNQRLFERYDSLAAVLANPSQKNFDRWPIIGTYVWPNNYVEIDYDDAVSYTRNWLADRLMWLDIEIPKLKLGDGTSSYTEPQHSGGSLILNSFQKKDFPLQLDIISISGQLLEQQTIETKGDDIEFEEKGVFFYRLKSTHGELKTGKLFMN